MNPSLKHAADLINSNQRDEAHQVLSRYLDEQPEDSGAWYLFSFTAPETSEKIAAVKRAVTLNPTSEKFRARLVQFQTGSRVPETRTRFNRLIAAALVGAVIVVLLGAWALSQNLQSSSRQLPTLIALADSSSEMTPAQSTMTGQETTPVLAISVTSDTPITAESGAQSTTVPLNIPDSASTAVTVITEDTSASTSPMISTAQTLNTSTAASVFGTPLPSNSVIALSGNATATQESAVTATLAPTATTGATQIAVISTATTAPLQPTDPMVVVDDGAPLNSALNVGTGEMRVITAMRPAENTIRELGGSALPAPTNQSWVLVELLLVCKQNTCNAAPSNFQIVGSSGAAYSASSSLNMSPIIGSSQSNGQTWGYIGFIVPNSESRLNLMFSQGSENHIFALQ